MKTDTYKNAETLRQIFSADKLDTSVLDRVLDTDTLLKIAKDGNDLANKNNEIRAHTDVPSYPDPNGKTMNSYVCEITITPTPNENGLCMSWFENSLEDINEDLISLGLQKVKDLGKIYTVHKHGIDINIIVKYITGEYDKRYESYSIPEIKSKFNEKLKEAIKKSSAKTNSYRRNNMKIQSKRAIKSGTSNFGSNDDVFGYSFPLVAYIAENYYYDEETDSETDERDYDADNWEYEDAIKAAEDLADEMNIPMYKDYSEPYLCGEPFMVEIEDGYYEGIYIKIREGTNEEDVYSNDPRYGSVYEGGRPFTDEEMNKFSDKIDAYLDELCEDYGWMKLGVSARFSNGETWYEKINNSRKPIKSKKSIKSGMSYQQVLDEFTAGGKPWDDYWSMQYDWTAFVDGLERDDLVDYNEARWWDNPCTPETFREWKNC